MNYQVSHTTTYEYTEPVALCQNLAHLTPRPLDHQRYHYHGRLQGRLRLVGQAASLP